MFMVNVPKTETIPPRSFAITGIFFDVVQKYVALRPKNMNENRFFVQFRDGKCGMQVVGQGKMHKMPSRIAKYLKLPQPDSYSSGKR